MKPKRHLESFGICGTFLAVSSATGFVLPEWVFRFPDFKNNSFEFGGASARTSRVATTTKNADAATLYENILTIQNAADLEWPATDPANAGVRGEFLLGVFPPDHGGNSTPQTPNK